MFSKFQIVALALAAFAAVAFAMEESSSESKEQAWDKGKAQTVLYGYQPQPKASYKPASAPVYVSKPRYGSSEEGGSGKYSFAYKVKAGGPVRKGYGTGSDSNERGYGSKDTAEFGHSETRDYGKTNGKYFVQLPDGRLQTVEYYVDGKSGYVAKVSYSDAAGKKY